MRIEKRKIVKLYPEAYLEPSRTSTTELLSKKVNGKKPLSTFAKKLHRRCLTGF